MTNKNMSPIVQANARTLKLVHPGYGRRGTSEHSDILLIITLCFLTYGLFIYFVMPTVTPVQYARSAAEFSYAWQNVVDSLEYRYYTSYLPYLNSLLQEAMVLIGR